MVKTLLSFVAIAGSVVLMSFGITSNFTGPDQGKWEAPASAKELKILVQVQKVLPMANLFTPPDVLCAMVLQGKGMALRANH